VPRSGRRPRTSPTCHGRSPRRRGARLASPRAAGRRGLGGGRAARRSRSRSAACRSAGRA
jgi:hypothetical protein